MIFGDRITIVRPLITRDRYGSDQLDFEHGQRHPAEGVSVQPRTSTESTGDSRDMVTTGWRIFTSAGVDLDITATDRVEWAGRTLEVIGDIARWPHPIRPGAVHHVEVDVERVTG